MGGRNEVEAGIYNKGAGSRMTGGGVIQMNLAFTIQEGVVER